MKYIFFINRFSLKEDTPKVSQRIIEVAKEMKLNFRIDVNYPDFPTEKVLNKYKDESNIIICVGGDGTINRALSSIVGTNNALGFIPYGTGNDFCRIGEELLNEGLNKVDLVKINDKYFINVACFGIDADIANSKEIDNFKFIPKSQRYNLGIIKNFLKYKPRYLEVNVNDEIYKGDYTTVALCNSRYYGGGYKIGTNALVDDGLIDIYLVDKMPKLDMAKIILGMKKGKHENSKAVKVIKSKKVFIESEREISCNIDGEVLTSNTFDVEVMPKAIDIYYNQELIDKVLRRGK